MLAVDGQELPAAAPVCGTREVAGGYEALLVCERERDAGLERPQRRTHAGKAHDRVEHDVRPRELEQRLGISADLNVLHPVGCGELVERLGARHERTEFELGMGVDDLDRLTADGPRCAEKGNPPYAGRSPLVGRAITSAPLGTWADLCNTCRMWCSARPA